MFSSHSSCLAGAAGRLNLVNRQRYFYNGLVVCNVNNPEPHNLNVNKQTVLSNGREEVGGKGLSEKIDFVMSIGLWSK